MAGGRFRMVRVPVPEWAPPYARGQVTFKEAEAKYYDPITLNERNVLLGRRADILTLADEQVEEYANDMCAPPGEDWFPEQDKLTGEFYIGSESYHRLPGKDWIQVCLRVRCLRHSEDGPEDYLGLDVWLRYDPGEDRLWVHRNPDSSVI
jgi:hypothetical protein